MKKLLKKIAPVAILVALGIGMLTACNDGDQATTSAGCAFRIGDGQDGRDSKIKDVYYPGQVIHRDKDSDGDYHDKVQYIPCNARNFIVNDGKQTDASGAKIGDRDIPSVGYTKEGTKVKVYYTMYWTLNQTKSVLENSFYPFCYKYECYSSSPSAGNANFSTKGWNGMLGENFPQAADAVALRESQKILTDASWKTHDTAQWEALEKSLSSNFDAEIRANTGVADDMFCGSGSTSGWDNPSEPGKGKFTCSNVRFKVTSVVNYSDQLQSANDNQTGSLIQQDGNTQKRKAAEAEYGPDGGYWLGLQDTIAACKQATNANCVIMLGGNSAPSITLPSSKR